MGDYVNGKALLEKLKPWLIVIKQLKAEGKPHTDFPQIPEVVGEGIMRIVNGLGKKANFYHYTFLDEMMSDAMLNCVAYLHNFNTEKSSNLFAYVTQIAYNSFIKRIQLEQKQVYTSDKLLTDSEFKSFVCEQELERKMARKQTLARTDFVQSKHESVIKYELALTERQNKPDRANKKVQA